MHPSVLQPVSSSGPPCPHLLAHVRGTHVGPQLPRDLAALLLGGTQPHSPHQSRPLYGARGSLCGVGDPNLVCTKLGPPSPLPTPCKTPLAFPAPLQRANEQHPNCLCCVINSDAVLAASGQAAACTGPGHPLLPVTAVTAQYLVDGGTWLPLPGWLCPMAPGWGLGCAAATPCSLGWEHPWLPTAPIKVTTLAGPLPGPSQPCCASAVGTDTGSGPDVAGPVAGAW